MHPGASFNKQKLIESIKSQRTGDDKKEYFKHQANKLANLQILAHTENLRKHATPLKEWRAKYKEEVPYLPDCSYELDDFEEFMQKRQKLMEDKLCEIFGVE